MDIPTLIGNDHHDILAKWWQYIVMGHTPTIELATPSIIQCFWVILLNITGRCSFLFCGCLRMYPQLLTEFPVKPPKWRLACLLQGYHQTISTWQLLSSVVYRYQLLSTGVCWHSPIGCGASVHSCKLGAWTYLNRIIPVTFIPCLWGKEEQFIPM